MKLKDFKPKTLKPMRDLIAYKWHKVDGMTSKSLIHIPDSVRDGAGESRMGHQYTCEVLAVGPEVNVMKVNDRFLLHEYGKADQGVDWDETEVMFVEEKEIKIKLKRDATPFVSLAKEITDKMMDEYEEY